MHITDSQNLVYHCDTITPNFYWESTSKHWGFSVFNLRDFNLW
jgi:hypothetical protein